MLQVPGFGDLIFLGYEKVPCTDNSENVFLTEWHIYGNESQGRIAIIKPNNVVYSEVLADYFSTTFNPSGTFHREINQKYYAIKDHLGSERVVISDVKEPNPSSGSKFYTTNISVSNYYPFGSLMSDISRSSEAYRYGYNGKENDNEIAGKNTTNDYGARVYANRLARFLSTDPLKSKFPSQSSYIYAGNNPIYYIDEEGESPKAFKTAVKVAYKTAVKLKKAGKLSKDNFVKAFKEAGVEEAVDFAGDFYTLVDEEASWGDKGLAALDIVTGLETNNKGNKAAQKLLDKFSGKKGEGIIYLRQDKTKKLDDYIGQSKNPKRYKDRQKEHKRANKDSDFKFKKIDEGNAKGKHPTDLDVKEQKAIDAGGGVKNKSNPSGKMSNKKNVIKKEKK
jgi:RHS repeat-associated protein